VIEIRPFVIIAGVPEPTFRIPDIAGYPTVAINLVV